MPENSGRPEGWARDGGGLTISESIDVFDTGPDGPGARAAETPAGAFRRSRGIAPVRRGLARAGGIMRTKSNTTARQKRGTANNAHTK